MRITGNLLVLLGVALLLVKLLSRWIGKGAAARRLDPRAQILYGVSLLEDGCGYFPDWSACMLREFDDLHKRHLRFYYEVANVVVKSPRHEWAAAVEAEFARYRAVT